MVGVSGSWSSWLVIGRWRLHWRRILTIHKLCHFKRCLASVYGNMLCIIWYTMQDRRAIWPPKNWPYGSVNSGVNGSSHRHYWRVIHRPLTLPKNAVERVKVDGMNDPNSVKLAWITIHVCNQLVDFINAIALKRLWRVSFCACTR